MGFNGIFIVDNRNMMGYQWDIINQWIGLREISEEIPIFHVNMWPVSCKFSSNQSIEISLELTSTWFLGYPTYISRKSMYQVLNDTYSLEMVYWKYFFGFTTHYYSCLKSAAKFCIHIYIYMYKCDTIIYCFFHVK